MLYLFATNIKTLEHAYKNSAPYKELEKVFVKQCAPNHMPDPKRQWSVLKILIKIIQSYQ